MRRRLVRLVFGVVATLTIAALVGFGALFWRLAQGPVSLDDFVPNITQALQEKLSAGYTVSISGAGIEQRGAWPSLTVTKLSIRDWHGRELISAPKAKVDFDPLRIFRPDGGLKRVTLIGPQFTATISKLGEFSLVAPSATGATAAPEAATPSLATSPNESADPTNLHHVRHGLVATYDDLFGRGGPFRVVDYVSVEGGLLAIDDRRSNEQLVFSDVSASFERGAREHLHIALKGPSGDWSLDASVGRDGQNERHLIVEPKNAPVGDVFLPLVPRPLVLAPNMPVSGRIDIDIDADGRAKSASGSLTAGAAAWNKPGESSPLLVTDEITAAFIYDGAHRTLDVTKLGVLAGDTRVEVTGKLTPAGDGNFTYVLEGSGGKVAGAARGEQPIALDRVRAAGTISQRDATISVSPLELSGKDVNFALNAMYRRGKDGGLTLAMQSGRMPARALLALWPPDVANDVRNFLITRLDHGTIEHFSLTNSLTEASLADAIADRPLPDDAVHLSVDATNAGLRYSDDLPALSNASIHVEGTGRTSTISITSAVTDIGAGRTLAISDGHFFVADTTKKPTTARVDFRVQGSADAFVAAMQRGAPPGAPQPLAPDSVSGVGDAHVQFTLPLGSDIKPSDVPLTVQGTLSKLSAQGIGAGQRLENARISFSMADNVITGKGEGRLAGVPVMIDLHKDRTDAQPQIKLSMTLDDDARAKLGLHAGKSIRGPTAVRIAAAADVPGGQTFDVDVDLTKATIEGFLPGWSKLAGRPGKLSFRVASSDGQTRFTRINLAANPVTLTGDAVIGKDSAIISAKFDTFKLSKGDDLRLDIARGDASGLKVSVRGAHIDMRPFIKSFMSGSQSETSNTDLDLKTASATGFGGEKASAIDLHLNRGANGLDDLRFGGKVGDGDVSAKLSREGRPLITIEAADAGAFLRFMDLYGHMNAGSMTMRLTPSAGSQAGAVSIRNFSLSNEEALTRILAASPQPKGASSDTPIQTRTTDAQFHRLQASFVRNGGRFDIREALIVGSQAGITLKGMVDFARDVADLSGTFVPAYGLNNAFSRVPLFGPLLGGGSNEGLLGVNFRVSGPLSRPEISVNPLSAMTPGFLRKIFEIGSPNAQDWQPEPNATPSPERGGR